MSAPDDLLAIVEDAVRRAMQAGADEAEAFVKDGRRMRVSCHGRLAQPTESHTVGIGIRIVHKGAIGVASSAGLHRIDTIIEEALAAARDAQPLAEFTGLPQTSSNGRAPTAVPDPFRHPDADDLRESVQAVLDALDDPRTDFKAISLGVGSSRFALANSHGLTAWDQGGRQSFDLELRVTDGQSRVTAWDSRFSIAPIPLDSGLVPAALDAQRRGLGALAPTRLPHDVHTAVLAPAATAQLLGRFIQALNGNMVANGASPLSERIGQAVATSAVSIDDLPNPLDGTQRARVDHEGVPTQNLTLIEDGIACTTYDDTLSGIAHGGSNGHAVRKGWSGSVSPGLLSPRMRPGDTAYAHLIEEMRDGILIEEPLTGMLTASIETGRFSAVLPYAYYIHGGEIVHALPNVTVSGNILDIANRIEAVEDRTHETPLGEYPAIRTGGITCAT